MIGTSSVLRQSRLFSTPPEDPPPPQQSPKSKEQECLSLLKRCAGMEDLKQVHAQVVKLGFFPDSFSATNLVAACALSDWGSMDYACSVFRQFTEPGTFEFNAMVRGYVNCFRFENALSLYHEMLEGGVSSDHFTYPALLKVCAGLRAIQLGMQVHGHILKLGLDGDLFVQNSLISMYGKCGRIELSSSVFEKMDSRDVASWSTIVSAHAGLAMWNECIDLFAAMRSERDCRPEESIFVSVLSACTHLGALDLGRSMHGSLLRNISALNVIVQTSLMDMYVKCGCMEKGLCLFRRMTKRNILSYSVMISGLAMHGRAIEALGVFSEMLDEGLVPDDVIYVGVLTACSHAGLVDEGLRCFDRMKFEHGIMPTIRHYGCMVDLLGGAGMLSEALELIRSMTVEPNEVIWRSLLSACKAHHNLEIGQIAAERLFQMNSHSPGDYLVLSNIYAKAHRWEDVAATRTEMASRGLIQTPGSSSVEVKRKFHKFVSQDMSHPQCKKIHEMIHQMEWQLKYEGYSPDTSQVLLDVEEGEKRQRLKAHSQKLAIAFALICTSQGTPIRIVRNVRMCNDCHTYTKLISLIYDREITVRDRNRFHHFKDGVCSFRDYR